MVEIGDMTARLVLGDGNMDEWNHARYISTLDILYWSVTCICSYCVHPVPICFCSPYKNCNEPFDLNDVAPAPVGASKLKGLVQVCDLVGREGDGTNTHQLYFSVLDAGSQYVRIAG